MKNQSRNILSAVTGIITAAITFLPLSIILLTLFGLIPFGDDPGANRLVYILTIVSIFISSFLGGIITGLFTDKNYLLISFITGTILTIIYFLAADFRINNKFFYTIALITIIPSTLLGSYLSNRNKINLK